MNRSIALRRLFGSILVVSLLFGCSRKVASTITVQSATTGARYSVIVQSGSNGIRNRASGPLGLMAAAFLSGSGFFKAQSAIMGVESQMKLIAPVQADELDDYYLLLQEYGSVLQVDIPDLLNRATDRAATLNEYITGLTNITARATQRESELKLAITAKQKEVNSQNKTLNDLQTGISKAKQAKDYATLGALQQQSSTAQATLAVSQASLKQLQDLDNIYNDLLDLANRRLTAIEANREILISGLKVVNVPGIDELDLIRNKNGTSSTTGFSFGSGLGF